MYAEYSWKRKDACANLPFGTTDIRGKWLKCLFSYLRYLRYYHRKVIVCEVLKFLPVFIIVFWTRGVVHNEFFFKDNILLSVKNIKLKSTMSTLNHFKMIIRFCVLGMLFQMSVAQMTKDHFLEFIQTRCYTKEGTGLVDSRENPGAQTLDYFLYLVENFERANPDVKLQEETAMFLRNYTYDALKIIGGEVDYYKVSGTTTSHIKGYWEQKLGNQLSEYENPFDDNEICDLFYMLSHTVSDISDPYYYYGNNGLSGRAGNDVRTAYLAREQGVVAIERTNYAVALGRVIAGIYLGLVNKGNTEELSKLRPSAPEDLRNDAVNTLYVLTLGDTLVQASWGTDSRNMAGNGKWTSINNIKTGYSYNTNNNDNNTVADNICPNAYQLSDDVKFPFTYSLLRGGADGLILGTMVSKGSTSGYQDFSNVRLSQLLRMYYSGNGIVISDNRYTFCSRDDLMRSPDIAQTLQESGIKNSVQSLIDSLTMANRGKMEEKIKEAKTNYDKWAKVFQKETEFFDLCSPLTPKETLDQLKCETPSHVIAVVDGSNGSLEKQRFFLGHLANHLKLMDGGSKMTVLLNERNTTTGLGLKEFLPETSCSSCVACAITQRNIDPSERQPNDFIIQSLDKFLRDVKASESELNGAPGLVVLYFNYALQEPSSKRLEKVLADLLLNNLDVTFFAIGKTENVLAKYARNVKDNVIIAVDEDTVEVETLAKKICNTHAALKYEDCDLRKNERAAVYDGVITPNTVQYWAMDSKYFLKSYGYKIFFEATRGNIKICHNRAGRPLTSNCQQTNSARRLEIKGSDPCNGYSNISCPPIYITLAGLSEESNGKNIERGFCESGETVECKTLDQIQFKVSHEGIRCSGCSSISSTLLMVILSLSIYSIFVKSS